VQSLSQPRTGPAQGTQALITELEFSQRAYQTWTSMRDTPFRPEARQRRFQFADCVVRKQLQLGEPDKVRGWPRRSITNYSAEKLTFSRIESNELDGSNSMKPYPKLIPTSLSVCMPARFWSTVISLFSTSSPCSTPDSIPM
jgi:hypothetical protein